MSTQQPLIGIIEDDADLLDELLFFLQQRNYNVWGASSAEQFWKKLHRNSADIVMVDIGLPGEDGFSVIEYLKDIGNRGVIVSTARGHQQDKLRGLNLGADLYLVKPVNFSKLASSIGELWQRMQQERTPSQPSHAVRHNTGQWQLVSSRKSLLAPSGEELPLSAQEYLLISTLARAPGEVFAKNTLLALMFRYEDQPAPHRIDVILSRLRKKIKADSINLPVRSIFGKGLVFVGSVEEITAN